MFEDFFTFDEMTDFSAYSAAAVVRNFLAVSQQSFADKNFAENVRVQDFRCNWRLVVNRNVKRPENLSGATQN